MFALYSVIQQRLWQEGKTIGDQIHKPLGNHLLPPPHPNSLGIKLGLRHIRQVLDL